MSCVKTADRVPDEAADPASRFPQNGDALAGSCPNYEFSERLTTFIGSDLDQRKRFYERVRADEGPDDAARWPRVVQESSVDTIFQLVWLASIVEGGNDATLGKSLDGIIRNASTAGHVQAPLTNELTSWSLRPIHRSLAAKAALPDEGPSIGRAVYWQTRLNLSEPHSLAACGWAA
jgi:hypothetical protein